MAKPRRGAALRKRLAATLRSPRAHPLRKLRAHPLQAACLAVAALLWALHFVHLRADFPANTPWMDWAKYTDEGWYGDGAVRQILFGHWYWPGDFNPAVALPVWPLVEWAWFHATGGVGIASARALTVLIFGLTIVVAYRLLVRSESQNCGEQQSCGDVAGTPARETASSPLPAGAVIAVLLLASSPFLFVFERMAVTEPLLVLETLAMLWLAGRLGASRTAAEPPAHSAPLPRTSGAWLTAIALGVLLPAAVLTKTTAVFLLPAVLYRVWARAGYRLWRAAKLFAVPALLGVTLWIAYFVLLVRPHYLASYSYLFSSNAYTGFSMDPPQVVVLNTLADGGWIGVSRYVLVGLTLLLALFVRGRLWRDAEFASMWVWVLGYFLFLGYHNNLQPRYYLVLAVPMNLIVARGLAECTRLWQKDSNLPKNRFLGRGLLTQIGVPVVVGALVAAGAWRQIGYVRHSTYAFWNAANGIAAIVRAEHARDGHPVLVQSISGSDITLMTGVPSMNDDFGETKLDPRVAQYRPGWFAAWNDVEDDKAEAIAPLDTMTRVAAFPAYDDPERNLLILYRLDARPTGDTGSDESATSGSSRMRRHTPHQLRSRLGEQPTTEQLRH